MAKSYKLSRRIRSRIKSLQRKAARAKVGTGKKFRYLAEELRLKHARTPDALSAWIGRKKYGKKRFGKLSRKGRKHG